MSAIVVGFTDNSHGRAALESAIEEATLRDARLVVVHSMKGGQSTNYEEVARYQKALKDVRARISTTDLDFDVSEFVRGKTPTEDLVSAVEDSNAQLLVIGYRRRTAAGKALLGSDAQDILMSSPVPVLAVSPQASD